MPERSFSLTPDVCVCVLSYQRLDLLRTTLRSIVDHIEADERGVSYELVWVDNGSDNAERRAVHAEFAFEKALFLGTNYGMAYGFNTLFFRLCSAPYFLTLEEDWEWIGARKSVLLDAMSVLRHDTSISGVFLRPDTLDQFLTRSAWRRTVPAAAVAVDANGRTAPDASGKGGGVQYATYCMDRQAAYLWGAYSNGPGLYDRVRLQQRVGRQFGEPGDRFPDVNSESNYAFRVGTAGLCSALLRVSPGCEGVHTCNGQLFRHLGDERSHGYGTGRKPEARWVLYGSNQSYDHHVVQLRALDIEPSLHWLSMYLTHGEQAAPVVDGGRLAVLIAARAHSLAPIVRMARAALFSAHAPELVELLWLLPTHVGVSVRAAAAEGGSAEVASERLAKECAAASAQLRDELAARAQRPVKTRAPGGHVLRCIVPSREASTIAERFSLLASATDAQLLWLCPRLVTRVSYESAGTAPSRASAVASEHATPGPIRNWDQQTRLHFVGDGDVRAFVKDRLLLLQAAPASDGGTPATMPNGHALVHRDALDHLGYVGPPAAGASWLHFSLHMQLVFGSVGRYRLLEGVLVEETDELGTADETDETDETDEGAQRAPRHEADDETDETDEGAQRAPRHEAETDETDETDEADGAPRHEADGGSNGNVYGRGAGQAAAPIAGTALREAFQRATVQRAIDTHRIEHLMLVLKLKTRSALEGATAAYARFAELYDAGELARAWPILAEVLWGLFTVDRSDDWALRDIVSPSMLNAAQDLQGKLLDRFAAAAHRTA